MYYYTTCIQHLAKYKLYKKYYKRFQKIVANVHYSLRPSLTKKNDAPDDDERFYLLMGMGTSRPEIRYFVVLLFVYYYL